MSVSLPSDLIVDVMRNADPARVSIATSKLHDLGGNDRIVESFATHLSNMDGGHIQDGSAERGADRMGGTPIPAASPGMLAHQTAPDAYVDFERMVLRNLLESLLPDAGSGTFGEGPSAGVWRTLAADQLAGLYAGTGGIGIAETLSGREDGSSNGANAQWPYFRTDSIKAFAG